MATFPAVDIAVAPVEQAANTVSSVPWVQFGSWAISIPPEIPPVAVPAPSAYISFG